MRPPEPATTAASRARDTLGVAGAYVALRKPRIVELLLVVTVPTMVLTQRGAPLPGLVVATLVGGAGPRRPRTRSTATSTGISTA